MGESLAGAGNSKRYFILKGVAGLGNRLMTLSNILRYVKIAGRVLCVDWSDGLYAPRGENLFYDYFRLVDVDHVQSINEIPSFERLTKYPAIWGEHADAMVYDLYDCKQLTGIRDQLARLLPQPYKRFRNGYFKLLPKFRSSPRYLLHATDYPVSMKQDVLIGADYRPIFYPEFLVKHVALREEIQDRFARIAKNLRVGSQTVGVNIRATDERPTRSLERLDEIIRKTTAIPGRNLFLATDNVDVRTEFRRRYPDVVFLERFLHPNTSVGVHQWASREGHPEYLRKIFEESLAELWLLSRCGTIVFPGESSFPHIARAWAAPDHEEIDWSRCD